MMKVDSRLRGNDKSAYVISLSSTVIPAQAGIHFPKRGKIETITINK